MVILESKECAEYEFFYSFFVIPKFMEKNTSKLLGHRFSTDLGMTSERWKPAQEERGGAKKPATDHLGMAHGVIFSSRTDPLIIHATTDPIYPSKYCILANQCMIYRQ